MPFVSVRLDTCLDLVRWLECGYPLHESYDNSFNTHNSYMLRDLILRAVLEGALHPRLASAFLRRIVSEELEKHAARGSANAPSLQKWIDDASSSVTTLAGSEESKT